jgi:hypothetical protein
VEHIKFPLETVDGATRIRDGPAEPVGRRRSRRDRPKLVDHLGREHGIGAALDQLIHCALGECALRESGLARKTSMFVSSSTRAISRTSNPGLSPPTGSEDWAEDCRSSFAAWQSSRRQTARRRIRRSLGAEHHIVAARLDREARSGWQHACRHDRCAIVVGLDCQVHDAFILRPAARSWNG